MYMSPRKLSEIRGRTWPLEWVQKRTDLEELSVNHLMCYGTNPILNDLIVIVDLDKTIFAFIPVKFEGNIILLTWKVAGAPTAALFVPSSTT